MPSFYLNLGFGVSIPLSEQSQSDADFNLERQKNLCFENWNILKHEDLKTCNPVECEDMLPVHMCFRPSCPPLRASQQGPRACQPGLRPRQPAVRACVHVCVHDCMRGVCVRGACVRGACVVHAWCVHACVHACVRASERACVRACVLRRNAKTAENG